MGIAYPRLGAIATTSNVTIADISASSPPYASMPINAGAGTGSTWAGTNVNNGTATTATGKLKVEGKDADIFINGQSLSDWMQAVDQRLSILQPRPELQEKYSALQAAYEHYKTLERLLYEQE